MICIPCGQAGEESTAPNPRLDIIAALHRQCLALERGDKTWCDCAHRLSLKDEKAIIDGDLVSQHNGSTGNQAQR